MAERYFERLLRWVERRPDEPSEWQQAAVFGDAMLYLTAEELTELGREILTVGERYAKRTADRALRPKEARLVAFLRLAFPEPPDG